MMNFVDHVKTKTDDTGLIEAAELLAAQAVDGKIRGTIDLAGHSDPDFTVANLRPLADAGLIKQATVKGSAEFTLVNPKAKATLPEPKDPAPRKLPRTGLETRPPKDQNEHTQKIINSSKLKKQDQHLALVVNIELAFLTRKAGGFAKVERELAAEYLAAKTGWSERSVRTSMANIVKAGFLVRLDYAKGGKNGIGKAKYRASLPDYG